MAAVSGSAFDDVDGIRLTAGTANFEQSTNFLLSGTLSTFNPQSGKTQIQRSARMSQVPQA